MAKGINNVCQRYNGSVLFHIKPTPGDRVVLRTSHGVYRRTFPEGYFMQPSPLSKDYVAPDKTNPVIKMFKRMCNTIKGIIENMNPEKIQDRSNVYKVGETEIVY